MSRSRPLRLVQIVPYPILPTVSGGKVRIVQLARALCKLGVDVTIVAPYHVTQRRALAELEPFTLLEVPYAPFLLPFLIVDRPFPWGALVSFHPGYRALLPVSLESFDVCQIDHPAFTDLGRNLPSSVPIVYGSQNVEFDYVSSESRPGLVRRMAGGRVRALEAELIARSAHVLACTDADRNRFRDLYGVARERICVLPNGIDLAAVDAARAHRRPVPRDANFQRRAIFAGSDVVHNRTAVAAILTQIAPALEDQVEFVIVGPCARSVRGQTRANVRLDPDGDVADYAGIGSVGLNPVMAGSGSSLKILHYLACDLPVLSTPFGMRGFVDLAPWVVTAELDDFAAALLRELPAPRGVRQQLARYEWSAVAERALEVYETLVRRA
jgi:glycosyltransferase involved in cell wall biosynthesis